MRFALALAAALVAAGVTNASFAAERGQVSQNALAEMGLGELHVLSDDDGQAVRGKATYLVYLNLIPTLNPAVNANFIVQRGLAATVHFPSFKGFYVAPIAF